MAKSYNCVCLGEISEKTSRFFERYSINSQRWFLFSRPDAWREDGEPFGSLVSIIKLAIWYNFGVPARAWKREKKKRKHLHNRHRVVSRKRSLSSFFLAVVDLWKDNVHTKEKRETHCNTSAIVETNNWWRMRAAVLLTLQQMFN